MKIAVTGASGFVGEALCTELTGRGHQVLRFVRERPKPGIEEAYWNPAEKEMNGNALMSCDAVIHLAGANIAGGRWSASRKELLRSSRVEATDFLARSMAELEQGPKVLICASAIGFYGDRGEEKLDESSAQGSSFLADLCRDWEAACEPARSAGIRVVNLRLGLVIGPGGALQKMLLPFKLGLGGRLGSGKQWMSFVDRQDLVRMMAEAAESESWRGPVNAVAPEAVTNLGFTKALGRVLSRPTIFPVPAFMMKLIFGEMADALFFASARVQATEAGKLGFEFQYPDIESSLRHALER